MEVTVEPVAEGMALGVEIGIEVVHDFTLAFHIVQQVFVATHHDAFDVREIKNYWFHIYFVFCSTFYSYSMRKGEMLHVE